jgi:opacity protein-like surface antigen
MKFKYLLSLSIVISSLSFAAESVNKSGSTWSDGYKPYQLFDSQFNIGLGASQGVTSKANWPQWGSEPSDGTYNNIYNTLEIEKLFSVGVWLLIDATLVDSYSQSSNQSLVAGQKSGNNITGNNPYFGGVSAKVGYAFPFNDSIMVTPYGMVGRSTNMSSFALDNLAASEKNITQSYYNSLGLGFRLEAIAINKYLELYLDEYLGHNFSETPIETTIFSGDPSYSAWTTTLGLKWRVADNFQVGANYAFSAYHTATYLQNIQNSKAPFYYYTPSTNQAYMVTFGFNY